MAPVRKPTAPAATLDKTKKSSETVPGHSNFMAEGTCEGFILELGDLPRFLVESVTLC